MSSPLVSVICLCYNHKRFIRESVESVLNQTYSSIELIIVDDYSTDGSQDVINQLKNENPGIEIVLLPENQGNCRAFNIGWQKAKGQYVIDFATDDVMMPDRIAKQVACFSSLDSSYGVVFSDAFYIDEVGTIIGEHTSRLLKNGIVKSIPEGDIFRNVLSRYFISGPTMMVRADVMEALNGYDEQLAYEDFDFWVRSSRITKYKYQGEKLTKVRKLSKSMSTGWYDPGDKQLHSTYMVCKKAMSLCKNQEDINALKVRVAYEYRQSLFSGNQTEAKLFKELLVDVKGWRLRENFFQLLSKLPLPWPSIRRWYHRVFYR